MSAFEVHRSGERSILTVSGDWTIETLGQHEKAFARLAFESGPVVLDVSQLGKLDTAGAYFLGSRVHAVDPEFELLGEHPQAESLISLVCDVEEQREPMDHTGFTFVDALARLGEGAIDFLKESRDTLAFIGQAAVTTAKLLLTPHKIRWTSVVAVMEEAGLNAMPIVAFLSFFVGMVIAFIGATILRQTLGATVFTIDLVGWSVLREFGVVLTGILLAGRTNSSFTAQIGSMKMRQEVDAMRTLGLDPMEVLVVPRILAMLLMTPFLAFASTLAGIFGGLFVSWLALDISPVMFLTRLQETVPIRNFWVGLSKAPVFALIVAIIACRQGLQVREDVQSLGRATTASVVHAIFLIIVADAIFALIYMELDI